MNETERALIGGNILRSDDVTSKTATKDIRRGGSE